MASIRFELEDSEHVRRQLGALGSEFTKQSGKIVVLFPDVLEAEALFLVVKGVTGHGMVAALDNGRKEEKFGHSASLEEYERESAKVVAAKTDSHAERMSHEEAARHAEEDSTFRSKEPEVVVGKPANEKDKKAAADEPKRSASAKKEAK